MINAYEDIGVFNSEKVTTLSIALGLGLLRDLDFVSSNITFVVGEYVIFQFAPFSQGVVVKQSSI